MTTITPVPTSIHAGQIAPILVEARRVLDRMVTRRHPTHRR